MSSSFDHFPKPPKSVHCINAHLVLVNAHLSSSSFLTLFNETRKARKAKGTPTDPEQDLLRAMLIFAAAGLDSMVKHLINDALQKIVDNSDGANIQFIKFVERKLNKGEISNSKFLAEILSNKQPRAKLTEMLVYELTSSSLQSSDELYKVASFFDIASQKISKAKGDLRTIFEVRNQISHEMDIDFKQPNRNRQPRAKDLMIEYTNNIFFTAEKYLTLVDNKIQSIS